MPERSKEYYAARRKVDEAVSLYNSASCFAEDHKLVFLRRAVAAQEEVARLEAAFIESLQPCRACGRKVTSPCHDAEGYYEGGPWDNACEDLVRQAARQ